LLLADSYFIKHIITPTIHHQRTCRVDPQQLTDPGFAVTASSEETAQ